MNAPEDIVWNEITASAKTRFDFQAFEQGLGELATENIAENIIFSMILGYATDKSDEAIASELKQQLAMVGIGFSSGGYMQVLKGKEELLRKEIDATKKAIAALEMGFKLPGILVQTRSILEK